MTMPHDAYSAAWDVFRSGGVLPWSPRGRVELRGKDRATLLHGLCTNEIKKLPVGRSCEAFFCQYQGRILAYGFVECQAERLIIETPVDQVASLMKHLDKYIIREDVQLADVSSETRAWLFLKDAGAAVRRALLGRATASDAPITAAGTPVRWRTTAWNPNGPDTIVETPGAAPAAVIEELCEWVRGQLASDGTAAADARRSATLLDADALELWRVAAKLPEYGRDISDETLPQEVDRNETAISFNKGCYLGQETVARIDARGHVNWNLAVFLAPGRTTADGLAAGQTLTTSDKPALRITTALDVPALRGVLGLGYIRAELRRAARPQVSCPVAEGVLTTSAGEVLINPQLSSS
ncbi:MAG: hypothetical protein U0939_10460 [Pirellulales bacterium]